MVDLGFLLFPLTLPCTVYSFLLKNLQFWTLDGRIVDSNFSPPISLSKFPSRTAARRNIGWVDVEEGATSTTNTRWIPSNLSKCQYFHGSRAYSIYSFVQLSWHSTGANELWMVNLGFLLFLFSLSCTELSTQETFKSQLWIVRSWNPPFPTPFLFPNFLLRQLQEWTLDG